MAESANTKSGNINDSSNIDDASAKKKRFADKEMRREDVRDDSDGEASEEQGGTWKRADESTMAQRKKVKVRRAGSSTAQAAESSESAPTAPAYNFTFNFASAPTKQTPDAEKETKKSEEKKPEEKKDEKNGAPSFNFSSTPSPFSSFTPQFTFSTSFSFSTSFASSSSSSPSSTSSAASSIFGLNIAPPSETSSAPEFLVEPEVKIEAKPLPPPEVQKTGEEEETHIFQTRGKLFIFNDAEKKWNERGVGNVRVNIGKDGTGARLLMRVEGSLRLVLNVGLWPAIRLEKTGDKAVRFTGPSTEKPGSLCVYLLKFAAAESSDQLIKAVEDNKHKGTPSSSASTTSSSTTTTTTTSSTPAKTTEKK